MNNRIYEKEFFAGNSSRTDSWKEHVLTFRMEYLGSNNSHRVVVTCHYIILPLDQSRHFGLSKSGSCSKNVASTEVRDSIPSRFNSGHNSSHFPHGSYFTSACMVL